ncbi:unnamed protein product [Heterobilharzia americana]|nr:unnamed protein product [Heterobilharzia americana]
MDALLICRIVVVMVQNTFIWMRIPLSEPELIESDSRRGIYLFCVQLTDNGKPPLQTTSWFYVKVTDPVIPPTVHNIWPADSANDMEITQKLMFSNMHNSTHTLWSSHILDTLKSDSIRLATDMNISNIVISLLLAIFAITIVCTLTASILWARSKRRSKRLNEKNDKTDCRDKNRIISYNATSKTTHKCRLLKKSLKITSSSNSKCSKDINTTQELIKLENRGPHFCISNAGIGGQIKDKNRYFGSCSSLYSNKSSNDVNCNTELGSPSKKLTANIHVVNNPNTEDVNNNSNILTHVNSTQSPRYHKSKKQKCLHEKSVPVKHHSKTLFQRNKPLRISIDNNYVALNKLSHSSVHCEQQLKHSSQEHTPLTENKMHAASESSYLLPCDLISVCTKHGQTGDNGRLHNCDNTVTLTNSSLVNTQPTTSQIKYLEPYLHNHPNYPQITQSKTHVTPSCQQQEQQYPLQCAAHYVPIDINNSAYSPTQKKVDCSTNIFSEGMITCCQTIPIVSTLSRGCPTHGPHLILHHDEHNNFSNSTRIYAVSSVLDSFGDLTTTITTAPTSTGATSTTKILTDQIQTTYELRLEPVSSDITLTATTTTDHEGEDGDDEQLRGAKTISWIPVSILTDNISSSIHQPDFMCHENN